MNIVSRKLKDNSGAGYIWFMAVLMIVLIMFAAIFTVISTTISTKNIRTEIDAAAEDVFANIRQVAYDNLSAGSTKNTYSSFTDVDIIEMFGEKLNVRVSYEHLAPEIVMTDARGKWTYTISNLAYTYIDDSEPASKTYVTYTVGDINRDHAVNSDDYDLAVEFFEEGEASEGYYWLDLDIDQNGIVEEKDIALLKHIVDYYALYSKTEHYETSVSILIITFDLEIPIKFADFDFGSDTDSYSFVRTLTTKPA